MPVVRLRTQPRLVRGGRCLRSSASHGYLPVPPISSRSLEGGAHVLERRLVAETQPLYQMNPVPVKSGSIVPWLTQLPRPRPVEPPPQCGAHMGTHGAGIPRCINIQHGQVQSVRATPIRNPQALTRAFHAYALHARTKARTRHARARPRAPESAQGRTGAHERPGTGTGASERPGAHGRTRERARAQAGAGERRQASAGAQAQGHGHGHERASAQAWGRERRRGRFERVRGA